MSKELLLIFVKHPIPGQVKTRLAATLGDTRALAIYQRLLTYTLQLSQELSADKVVFYGNEIPPNDLWQEAGYRHFLQQGPDLGSRMQQAFDWGFKQGYERIQVIGSDCAQLTSAHLQKAFQQLNSHDAVLGPAKDGGYYSLGLREMIPALFVQKDWSTSRVFPSSLNDLVKENKAFFLLQTLSDIDHEEDLVGTFLEEAED